MVFDILITIMSLSLIGVMGGLLHIFCAILGRKEVAQALEGHFLQRGTTKHYGITTNYTIL